MNDMSDADIIIAGIVGTGGAKKYIENRFEEINKNLYDDDFLKRVLDYGEQNKQLASFIKDAGNRAGKVSYIDDMVVSEVKGSLHDALWKVANEYKIGFEVTGKKIPIAQEIVEIYETFGTDMYKEMSENVFIIFTYHAGRVLEGLLKKGFRAEIVGFTTNDKKRVIINGDRVTYLQATSQKKGESHEKDRRNTAFD